MAARAPKSIEGGRNVSYSLAISNGDLAVQGDRLGLVFGTDKLKQDMNCWLNERYGGDRFHRNYGSILQDFIGGVISDSTRSEVQAEVLRVAQNYQATQQRVLRESPAKLSASELLIAVDNIKTEISYDTVTVELRMVNGSNEITDVLTTTGTN